jgi:GNAT superfamily N-acetyltransferase
MDFNVLLSHRRRGVGTALMDTAKALIAERATAAGLGCGLYADYGPALLLYLKRGYLPDGRGVVYDGQHIPPGGAVRLDDSAAMMLTKPLQ